MYTIKINGVTYPKVVHFRTSQSKLGQRIVIEQANGVQHSILISEINKLEIEREENDRQTTQQFTDIQRYHKTQASK